METTKDYFNALLKFLFQYQYFYGKPNTHLLTHKVTEQIPSDWIQYFQDISDDHTRFNNIALGIIDEKAPVSFKHFLGQINDLRQHHIEYKTNDTICLKNPLGLNQKKLHEILNLAPLIHSQCQKYGVKYIIDIGAGLGYLPNLLHNNYNYNILGIEGNKKYVETAERQQKDSSKAFIKYKHLFVTSNSAQEISTLLCKSFHDFDPDNDPVCIIALHACADLSVHMINIFNEIPYAKCAVIMPCCYHRLNGDETTFDNFPLSDVLKGFYCELGVKFLTRPFLRLACQQSSSIWKNMDAEEHKVRARNCLLRNILQEVIEKERLTISRLKRKTGNKNPNYTIDSFLSDLEDSYVFKSQTNGPTIASVVKEIKHEILKQYTCTYSNAECVIQGISAIQGVLQCICEDLILLDRCAYANELSLHCYVNKVTDDSLSPRCFALLVSK